MKQDEPKIESKVTKGKPKKAAKNSEQDVEYEAGPSNTQRKNTKTRSRTVKKFRNRSINVVQRKINLQKKRNQLKAKQTKSKLQNLQLKHPNRNNNKSNQFLMKLMMFLKTKTMIQQRAVNSNRRPKLHHQPKNQKQKRLSLISYQNQMVHPQNEELILQPMKLNL